MFQVANRSLQNEKKELERMHLFERDVSTEVRELYDHLSKTYGFAFDISSQTPRRR